MRGWKTSSVVTMAFGVAALAGAMWCASASWAGGPTGTFDLKAARDYDFYGAKTDAKFLGLDGCSSSSCHDGGTSTIDPSKVMDQKKAYKNDPHSEAHLGGRNIKDKAKEIAGKLGIDRAHKSERCLACHATGGRNFDGDDLPKARQGPKFSVRDGVSCEACHGAGEKYVDIHKKADGYAQAVAAGMTPTLDPLMRANLCLSCHGKIDAELVTKGGHPAAQSIVLNVYRREHQHWPLKTPGDEARVWLIGQIAGLYGNISIGDKPDGADTARAAELAKAHHTALNTASKALGGLGLGDVPSTTAGAEAAYGKIKADSVKIADADAKALAKVLADAAAASTDMETVRQLLGGVYTIGSAKDAGMDATVKPLEGPIMDDKFTLEQGTKLAKEVAAAIK